MKLWTVAAVAATGGEVLFDHIVLGFDEACQSGGGQTLVEYVNNQMRVARSAVALKELTNLGTVTDAHLARVVKDVVETNVDDEQREDAARRQMRKNTKSSDPVAKRMLSKTPRVQREDEILGLLHIMAALGIAQGDEKQVDKVLSGSPNNVTVPKSLEYIPGLKVITNPVLGEKLLKYAQLLPCLEFPPQPDRRIEVDPPVPEPAVAETKTKSSKVINGETYILMDYLDKDLMQARLAEEAKTGTVSLRRKDGPKYYMKRRVDLLTAQTYQLNTYTGDPNSWGSGFDSAWMMLAMDVLYSEDPSLRKKDQITLAYEEVIAAIKRGYPSPVVGIVDTGCYKHGDLIDGFWRNPHMKGCTGTAVVGTGGDDGHGYPNACIGYSLALDNPDPTINIKQNHGTAVSGSIGALADNNLGAAGGCPWCRIMCLKVDDQVSLVNSAILQASNFAIAYGANITNHSYGMFGNYLPYKMMHEALSAADIFQTASAGNDGCDMDDASFGSCTWGGLYPHIPSAYCMTIPGVMSIGSTDNAAVKAATSNWGLKSTSVFAPGRLVGLLNGESGAYTASGTSYASPLVAAVGAVLKTKYPTLANHQIVDIIEASAMPVPGLKGLARSGGIADAHRALAYAPIYLAK